MDIEIWNGDFRIYEASHPIHYFDRSSENQPDDPLQLARTWHALHDADLSLLYYGLSDSLSGGVDIVPFAESLIARGLYDEAEHRLRSWLAASPPNNSDTSFALDLLCVEIARARLPGWRSEIDDLLSSKLPASAIGSVEANLGHAAVADGDLSSATARYAEASARNGERLIHFANGIHTAKFALDWPGPEVSEPIETIVEEPGLVHLFACDGDYFVRYARKLVESSVAARGNTPLFIHGHVVDPTDEARTLAAALQKAHDFDVTFEETPTQYRDAKVRRAYYTCARFLQVSQVMRRQKRPVVITETDCLINWKWADFIRHIDTSDVGYFRAGLWNWVPWTQIPAGIFLLSPTRRGLAIADCIAHFLDHVFRSTGGESLDLWTVDQVALWLAHTYAPEGTKRVHLPMSSILTLATGDKLNI